MTIDSTVYTKVLFGEHAVHVPAWLYVQHMGPGLVAFTGASRVPEAAHPLRFGSGLTHQLVVGELIVRPQSVIESDLARGAGLGSLAIGSYHEDFAREGRVLVGV